MRRGVKALAAAGVLLVAAAGVGLGVRVRGAGRGTHVRSEGGVTVDLTRLGKLAPKTEDEKGTGIDPVPVVLWGKKGPGAVLAYRTERDLAALRMKQDFVDLGPGRGNGVEYHFTARPDIQSDMALDLVDVGATAAADVNGDGEDELVRVRTFGLVEVFQRGKAVQTLAGLNPAPLEVRYEHWQTQKVRLPGRDVLLMLFRRRVFGSVAPERLTELGAAEPYALVRIDQRGAARVKLQGLEKVDEVLAVGVVNRPGSQDVDELLAVSRVERKAVLSRHRADGAAIGPPREIYEPFDPNVAQPRFCFVAQSDRAVLFDSGQRRTYFVGAAKPVNWVRSIDLQPILDGTSGVLRWLGTVKTGAELAAVVSVDASVYGLDEEGKYWGWQGGRWGRLAKRGPMTEVAGPEGHDLVGIYSAGEDADELLTVHARHVGVRPLTEGEIDAAVKRFLPDFEAGQIEEGRHINMAIAKQVWGNVIAAEMAAANVKGEITTPDELKQFAPKAYAEIERMRRDGYWVAIDSYLYAGLNQGGRAPKGYKDPAAYEAWLKGLTLPASTTLTLLRQGERVTSFQIEGVPLEPGPEEVPGERVQFRASADEVNVVLPLARPPESALPGGFYLVRARTEAHG